MKKLLIVASLFLASCSKTATTTQSDNVFYRVDEVDADGTTTSSPVARVSLTNQQSAVEGDNPNCPNHPVSVKFSAFSASIYKSSVKVNWTIAQPENVKEYRVQRSGDAKTWNTINVVLPSETCDYSYTDNL